MSNQEQDIADCAVILHGLLGHPETGSREHFMYPDGRVVPLIEIKTHTRNYFWPLWDAVEKKGGDMFMNNYEMKFTICHEAWECDMKRPTIEEAIYECCLKYCKEVLK